ncbi:ABC transporter permease [Streptomyces lunaelactis]|uniref:ABC transporter permease n=1 Tax=Streptomyces lunaelactis TaxID=1535768 RepID=A0A2R4T877_9ACTN|nr:ABC transporter permease subunit [Streptomyces lunaelactis]AVZ75339.1 ABC transporter permease [Streptomyces lunaelactis]NUK05578.1 ABC transporter permease subunit [Streptomyces lunaelactis]NUK08916.1 ABC transporter permease subunit [Streptomyces lunaelactis]NUK19973.1 ABC transporter permease subunit [Streptomyces lunaelactis]NUK23097.1 ABC transporter permease subunit [Streptomyces lunaelactis]
MSTPYQQQGYQQQGAPGTLYSSPIPVRSAHLGDALASEWTKIRSVRSTMWTLGVMITLMVGIGVLSAVAVSASDADLDGQSVLSLGFFGVLLGSICVMTLGVLTIASEFGTGMIRTTLTACPSRARVLTAKAIVFFLLVFTLTTVITGIVGGLQISIVDQGSSTGEEWFRATVGVALYVATLGLLSLAVGTLIRHSAGAITIMIGVVLLPLVLAMFMFSESLRDLQQALFEYSIPNQIGVLYDTAVTESGPAGWDPLWIMLGVTAVALAGAYASLRTRDV